MIFPRPAAYHLGDISRGGDLIHIVWEFRVKPERRSAFEEHYSGEGSWARLFRRSPDYHGTTLLRDVADPDRYLTVDLWTTHEAFADFKRDAAQEYEALDLACSELTQGERRVGDFEGL